MTTQETPPMPDASYHLTGADRLTVQFRPQGCTDLVLDGTTDLCYLTGIGGNAIDILTRHGLLARRLGDPLAPPSPPDLVAALVELVEAVECTGVLGPVKPSSKVTITSPVEPAGRIAPHLRGEPSIRSLLALRSAMNRARRTLNHQPV